WRGVMDLAEPDLVLADYAPTALLAAAYLGIPRLSIGNGFAVPPQRSPWPSIRPDANVSPSRLSAVEGQLDRQVAQAHNCLGWRASLRVRELFSPVDLLDTFAELDHYGYRAH